MRKNPVVATRLGGLAAGLVLALVLILVLVLVLVPVLPPEPASVPDPDRTPGAGGPGVGSPRPGQAERAERGERGERFPEARELAALVQALEEQVGVGDAELALAAWSTRAEADPGDPVPVLARLVLDRLTFRLGHPPGVDARIHEAELATGAACRPGPPPRQAEAFCLRLAHEAALDLGRRASGDDLAAALHEVSQRSARGGDSILAAEAGILRAGVLVRTEGAPAALSYLSEVSALISPDDLRLQALRSCQEAAILAVIQSPDALGAAQAGVALAERAGLARLQASCLLTLGQAWSVRGRGSFGSAREALTSAAQLQQTSGDPGGRAASLQWLATVERSSGNYERARLALEEASAEARVAGNRSVLAWAELGLAGLHADLGDHAALRRHLVAADSAMRSLGDRVGLGYVATMQVEDALLRGRPDEALERLDRAESDLVALGDAQVELRNLPLRISVLRRLGQVDEAAERAEELLVRTAWGRTLPTGSLPPLVAAAALLDAGRVQRSREVLDTWSPSLVPGSLSAWTVAARRAEIAARQGNTEATEAYMREALEQLAGVRAGLYSDDLRLASRSLGSVDSGDPDLGVATALAHLARSGQARAAFEFASELQGRELEARLLRRRILEATPSSGTPDMPLSRGATLDQVQAALAPNEALLLYVTGRSAPGQDATGQNARDIGEPTTLFVVTPDNLGTAELEPIDALEPRVIRLLERLDAGDSADPLRRELGERLVEPAVALLPAGTTRLLVVMDDGLYRLPLDVLLLSGGETVIERFTVAGMPSPGTLLLLRGPQASSPSPGARGVLALSRSAGLEDEVWGTLPRLPWTRVETHLLRWTLPGSKRAHGSRARRELLEAGAEEGYSVLHLATHAVVDDDVPARSTIFLGSGPLRLAELEGLHLPYGLVVLSACGTAGGQSYRGEGLRGLATAFLSAGSRSVVATAWDVGDRDAALQMHRFYRALAEGYPADEALALTKRHWIQRGHSPASWGAFQLLGEPGIRVR